MLRVLKIYFKIYNHFEDRFYNKKSKICTILKFNIA